MNGVSMPPSAMVAPSYGRATPMMMNNTPSDYPPRGTGRGLSFGQSSMYNNN